jgi:hypothetical protein
MSQCQWLISRGYHRGERCGNDTPIHLTIDGKSVWLCPVHLGMSKMKPTCWEATIGRTVPLLSEHGRWRDRKAVCQVCGCESVFGQVFGLTVERKDGGR